MRTLAYSFALSTLLAACGGAPPPAAPTAAVSSSTSPAADTDDAKLQRCFTAAKACVDATLKKGFVAAIDCMPDDVIVKLGGRDKLVAETAKIDDEMKKGGASMASYDVTPPTKLATGAGTTFAVVPSVVVVHVGGKEGSKKGYMLAVSSDDGATWHFVSGTAPDMIRKMYPNLPADFALPAAEKTRVRADTQ